MTCIDPINALSRYQKLMLRINRQAQNFVALESPTLADCSITERYDLQEFTFNSPSIFFKEIGQDLTSEAFACSELIVTRKAS